MTTISVISGIHQIIDFPEKNMNFCIFECLDEKSQKKEFMVEIGQGREVFRKLFPTIDEAKKWVIVKGPIEV